MGFTGPALIVASPSPRRFLQAVWERSLGGAGVELGVHEFGGECTRSEVVAVVSAAKALKAQVIVGAGGGKVLDAARAAAAELDLPVVNCRPRHRATHLAAPFRSFIQTTGRSTATSSTGAIPTWSLWTPRS